MQPEAATVIRKKLSDRRQNTGCAIASLRVLPGTDSMDLARLAASPPGRSLSRNSAFGTVTRKISRPIIA